MYNVTDIISYYNIDKWNNAIYNDNICKILAGIKSDSKSKRMISYDEGQKLGNNLQITFLELNSKTGKNINQLFYLLVEKILSHKNTQKEEYNNTEIIFDESIKFKLEKNSTIKEK